MLTCFPRWPHRDGDLEGAGHDDARGEPDERRDGLVDRGEGAHQHRRTLGLIKLWLILDKDVYSGWDNPVTSLFNVKDASASLRVKSQPP